MTSLQALNLIGWDDAPTHTVNEWCFPVYDRVSVHQYKVNSPSNLVQWEATLEHYAGIVSYCTNGPHLAQAFVYDIQDRDGVDITVVQVNDTHQNLWYVIESSPINN